tara:strand:- start:689 stop:844 length:156 start_codon:yes stop_codon:yes gene_type:complete
MRTFGKILKRFFASKGTQTWVCVPSTMDSVKEKKYFIKETKRFLEKTIKIK